MHINRNWELTLMRATINAGVVQKESNRGRDAEAPQRIPHRGWRDILLRSYQQLLDNNIGLVAAGVAFYSLLALFPALTALVASYGLLADPEDVQRQLALLSGLVPQQALQIIKEQLTSISTTSSTGLSIGLAVALLVAFWSASKGARALMTSLNIVYHEHEKRGIFKFYFLSVMLTVVGIIYVALALMLVVAIPAFLGNLGLPDQLRMLVSWSRWPLLALLAMFGLAALYRFGPSRTTPRWQWVSIGAVVAAVLWLLGSGLFSYYVTRFATYNETYGSLGAVIILLMWFYLSAYVALLGAQLNAETEHQTAVDSTVGCPKPMGSRGAHMADTLGEKP